MSFCISNIQTTSQNVCSFSYSNCLLPKVHRTWTPTVAPWCQCQRWLSLRASAPACCWRQHQQTWHALKYNCNTDCRLRFRDQKLCKSVIYRHWIGDSRQQTSATVSNRKCAASRCPFSAVVGDSTHSESFLSASLYFSKRGTYWDRLCRDVVGRWLVGRWLVGCHARALWPNGAS